MTRYLVTGAGGMLGSDLLTALTGRDVTGLSRAQLDVTDAGAVSDAVAGHHVVINAAAYTRVDEAESDEAEAHRINGGGAANLATAAAIHEAALVQVSTDYVFDGTAIKPYPESQPLSPVSAYGRTKADGERLARELNPGRTWTVRTAWLYGANGPNFPRTMLRLARESDHIDVVDDQVGQPTWTVDLADRIVAMLDAGAPAAVYHATNSGQASWYEFARAVFELGGFDPDRVKPTDSSQFTRPATRPAYSVLDNSGWGTVGLPPMRHWMDALRAAFSTGALKSE